jgi:mxaC protein
MPLTQSRTAIDAAIMGTQTGSKGTTNIAPALAMALGYFDQQPLTSSRIILLISDGAAKMEAETQVALRQLFQQNQARLYWIYLRNRNGVTLSAKPKNSNESMTPELFLHQFYQTLDVPYRAFEAENPQMLRDSITEIDQLENKPILYYEKTPRRDLANWCYAIALFLLVLLIPLRMMELRATSLLSQDQGA